MPYGPRINAGRNALTQALMNLRNPPPGGGMPPGGGTPLNFAPGVVPGVSNGALPNFEADRAAAQASKMAGGMGAPGSIGAPMPATTPGVTNYYGNMGGGGMPMPSNAMSNNASTASAPYTGMSMQQMSQPFQPAQGPSFGGTGGGPPLPYKF